MASDVKLSLDSYMRVYMSRGEGKSAMISVVYSAPCAVGAARSVLQCRFRPESAALFAPGHTAHMFRRQINAGPISRLQLLSTIWGIQLDSCQKIIIAVQPLFPRASRTAGKSKCRSFSQVKMEMISWAYVREHLVPSFRSVVLSPSCLGLVLYTYRCASLSSVSDSGPC